MLSTLDLRLLAEKILNPPHIDNFDPEALGLDKDYLIYLREGLLKMVNALEQTGEFEIEIPDEVIEHLKTHEDMEQGDCGCGQTDTDR